MVGVKDVHFTLSSTFFLPPHSAALGRKTMESPILMVASPGSTPQTRGPLQGNESQFARERYEDQKRDLVCPQLTR